MTDKIFEVRRMGLPALLLDFFAFRDASDIEDLGGQQFLGQTG